MTDIKFDVERSEYFNGRSKLLALNKAPKLSDAKANLGDSLAKVVFEQCEEALREDFGLKVPLKGPGDILWVSPSDLLIGKIALKPPFTPKCLQALTHRGILEIGLDLENKFRQEMELDKQRTLEKYKAELLATIDDRMKAEIKDVEIRERLACHMEMEKQEQEFQLLLKEELEKLEKRLRVHYEKIITKNEENLRETWEQKLSDEVKKTVAKMTKVFLAKLEEQEDKLTNRFFLELRKAEILRDYDAKLHKRKMNDALRQLRHNLECTNLVNMMYMLCTERRACCEKKEEIEVHYQKKMSELQEKQKQKDEEITKLKKDKDHLKQEVSLRETCVLEVIKHFQKFINFALRSAPTQAEFLLSVEKMMVFELTNVVATTKFPRAHEQPLIIPWNDEFKTNTPPTVSSLEIPDHHNCLKELNPPLPENGSELDEDSTLPAMYFKNKMYVREDFRDILSSGVEIRSSNELWNRDVEILIDNWKKQSAEVIPTELTQEEKSFTESINESSTNGEIQEDNISVTNNERRRSKQSTVQFTDTGSVQKISETRKSSRKSSLRPASFPIPEIKTFDVVNGQSISNILAARDSIEVLNEKKNRSSPNLANQIDDEILIDKSYITDENTKTSSLDSDTKKELVVETRDSIIIRMSSLAKHQPSAEFTTSPRDSIEIAKCTLDKAFEVKSKPSKLTSSRNSVEILRESLLKLREPSIICQRKDYHQGQSSPGSFGFADTCCGRCKRKDGSLLDPSDTEEPKEGSKILKSDSLSDEKSVKISHIQVINLDDNIPAPSVVSFHVEPRVYEPTSFSETDAITKTSRSAKRKKKLPKRKRSDKVYKLKVVGDQYAKEGEQSNEEFTADRIHSLVNLMRDHPQLMQLFTAGSR